MGLEGKGSWPHSGCRGREAGSGKRRWWRIDGEDPRRPEMGKTAWAAMQGVRQGMGWWRGRAGRGGASGRNDEARQWLWPRRRSSAAVAPFG